MTFFKRKEVDDDIEILDNDFQIKEQEVDKWDKKSTYVAIKSTIRNVLVIGKTKVGKSTLINVIKSLKNYTEEMKMFSQTEHPYLTTLVMSDDEKKDNFTINIIDTPGFKEVKSIGSVARSDETLSSLIITLLKYEITKLNLVIMCYSPELGIDDNDVKILEDVCNMFGDDITIIVCITRSEELGKTGREKKVEELKKHDRFAKIIKRIKIEPFFIGAVNINKITKDKIQEVAKRVYIDRENLVEFIKFNQKLIEVKKLAFVKNEQEKVHVRVKVYIEALKTYSKLADYQATGVSSLFCKMDQEKDIHTILDFKQNKDWTLANTLKRQLNARIWRESKLQNGLNWSMWSFITHDSSWDKEIYIEEERFNKIDINKK